MVLACAISRLIFPASRRTLEAWPLRFRRVSSHAVAETNEAFAHAWRNFDSAPVAMGDKGRRHDPARDCETVA
jgi:hypothetical protein